VAITNVTNETTRWG